MKRGLLIYTCPATLLKCKKNIDVYITFYTTFVALYRNYLIIVERRSAQVLGECLKRTMRRPKTALPGQIQMKIKKNKIFRLTRVVRSTAVVELSIDWLGSALCSGEGNLQTINRESLLQTCCQRAVPQSMALVGDWERSQSSSFRSEVGTKHNKKNGV